MAFGPSFETLARSYPDGETTNAQYQTKASGLGRFAPPGNDPHAMWLPAIASLLVCVLGAFLAYGPYQDDRTWNLVRNTVSLERVGMRALEQSHFRLYGLRTGTGQRTQANSDGQVLFVPGHGGAWTQTINLASYVAKQQSDIRFFALDFHASASALHWSVVEAQADFTVAAVIELAKPQRGPLVLLCHSMGGLVALESLRLLGDRRSLVAGVVLVSAPTAEHPLLLEARFAYRAAAAREEAWTFQSPPIVSISGGATDALVPMTATILPQRPQAATLLLPAARDVYSSFSHVNVLFSRHSLHALSALLRGALAGRLLRTAESLRSPLSGLLQPTQLVAAPSPWSAQRLMAQVSDSTWTTLASDVAFSQLPEQKAHAITLLHELEAGVLHLLPAPESGGTLTLMLLEEPRPIKRTPEPTTRGENFDPKDVLDCSAALSAVVTSGGRDDSVASLLAGSAWMGAAPVKLQYPSKACFYQIPSPSSAQLPGQRGLAAIMVNAQRSGSGRRIGWVQWQLGAAAQDLQCNRAGENLPVLSWLASVAWPVRCRLPAGRGLLTRVGLSQSWRMLPFLPLDVRLVQEEASGATAATWRPPVLLLLTADNHTRMAALPFPTEPRQLWFQGWAAESSEATFAPRLVEVAEEGAAYVTVMGHPDVEITLEVQGNAFSALAEIFRRFLRPLLVAWIGAATALTAAEVYCRRRPPRGCFALLWLTASVALQVVRHASASLLPLQLAVALLAWGLAHLSRLLVQLPSACCHKTGEAHAGAKSPGLSPALCWLVLVAFGSLNPGGCLVLLIGSSVVLLARLPRDDQAEAPLLGLASVLLGPMLMCYLPSIVFLVWLLLGMQNSASTTYLQWDLDAQLPSSPHAASPWADAMFRVHWEPLPPVLALLAPAEARHGRLSQAVIQWVSWSKMHAEPVFHETFV
ncbi:bst1 [Symbiodinium microadriaticum]|nr:bst1 [Symbiodinium microadriaticum]